MLVEVDGHRVAGLPQKAAVLAEEVAPQVPEVLARQRERGLVADSGLMYAIGSPGCQLGFRSSQASRSGGAWPSLIAGQSHPADV